MIREFIQKLFSFTILLGFGIYTAVLFSTNKLFYYIHERFFGGIQASFILSIFVAVSFITFSLIYFLFKKGLKKTDDIKTIIEKALDVKVIAILLLTLLSLVIAPVFVLLAVLVILAPIKGSRFNIVLNKVSFGNVIIILILILSFAVSPKPLSSGIANQRENSYSTYTNVENKVSALDNFNTSTLNYDIKDWLNSMNYNPDLEFYKNKEVSLSGFIYLPENANLGDNQFLISRFVVSCCAVDAIPVGLKVKYDFKKDSKQDDWIQLVGKFDIQNGELVIIPEKITKISVPDNPYLYL